MVRQCLRACSDIWMQYDWKSSLRRRFFDCTNSSQPMQRRRVFVKSLSVGCAQRRALARHANTAFSALLAQPFALSLRRKSCVGCTRGRVVRFFIGLVVGEKHRASLATLFKSDSQYGRILCRLTFFMRGSTAVAGKQTLC